MAYTNVGQYYYKTAVEGESHTLVVDVSGGNVIFTFDGSVIHTVPLGDTGWSIPLYMGEDDSHSPFIVSLIFSKDVIFGDDDSAEIDMLPWMVYCPLYGPNNIFPLRNDLYYASYRMETSDSLTLQISGTTVDDGDLEWNIKSYMADTGDLVLAESPIVDSEQYIYTIQHFQLLPFTPVNNVLTTKYVDVCASGTLSTIGTGKAGLSESDGTYVSHSIWGSLDATTWEDLDWYDCDSELNGLNNSDVTVRTTSTEDGLRLNGIDAIIHWDGQPTDTVTLTKFIVPVEVGGGPSPEPSGSTVENVTLSTYAGWSTFRKAQLTNAEITNGAVDLTDAFGKNTTVTEILGIQSDIYVSFDFDPKTQKLKLYTATNTPASGTATVVILALAS